MPSPLGLKRYDEGNGNCSGGGVARGPSGPHSISNTCFSLLRAKFPPAAAKVPSPFAVRSRGGEDPKNPGVTILFPDHDLDV